MRQSKTFYEVSGPLIKSIVVLTSVSNATERWKSENYLRRVVIHIQLKAKSVL